MVRTRWGLTGGYYVELVPGPHPYVWVGDDDGHCLGSIGGASGVEHVELLTLRDALTVALRDAARAGVTS